MLTQMALTTRQLFSHLWQYKSQAVLCTRSPLFILVCGSSRKCDLMLTLVALLIHRTVFAFVAVLITSTLKKARAEAKPQCRRQERAQGL